MQEAGLIRYAGGHIKLLDIAGLKQSACECYETVKLNYAALLQGSENGEGAERLLYFAAGERERKSSGEHGA